jgi:hypothetical protein
LVFWKREIFLSKKNLAGKKYFAKEWIYFAKIRKVLKYSAVQKTKKNINKKFQLISKPLQNYPKTRSIIKGFWKHKVRSGYSCKSTKQFSNIFRSLAASISVKIEGFFFSLESFYCFMIFLMSFIWEKFPSGSFYLLIDN